MNRLEEFLYILAMILIFTKGVITPNPFTRSLNFNPDSGLFEAIKWLLREILMDRLVPLKVKAISSEPIMMVPVVSLCSLTRRV